MDVNANSAVNRSTIVPSTTQTTSTSNTTSTTNTTQTSQTEEKKSGGLLGFIGDVFVGGGKAIVDMGKGLVNTVLHPIQTIKGLGYVVTHPSTLVHAFVDPYMEAINSGHPGEALGRGIVEIGSLFINPSEVVGGVAKGFNAVKSAVTGVGKGAKVASTTAGVAQAARYASSLTKGITTVESKAAALTKAGDIANAAKMAAYAETLASAKALATAGDVSGAMKMVQAASKGAEMASTFKAANAALKASTAVATGAEVASKTSQATSKIPTLTKTAAKELQKIGITDQNLINDALKAAKKAYTSTKNLPNLTATDAKLAAAHKAASVLGIDANSVAAEKIANAVSLHGAAADAVKASSMTATLSNGTKLTNGVSTAATTVAAEGIGDVVVNGAKKIADTTIGDIVTAPITAGKKVVDGVTDAASKVADNVSDIAGKIADTTIGDIVTAPITAGKKVVGAVGDAAGKVADNIGDLVSKGSELVSEIPGKVAGAVSSIGAMKVGDILKIPAQLGTLAIQHPQITMAAGMVANRLQNLPVEASQVGNSLNLDSLTQEQATEIASKYGLDPALENVKRFLTEVSEYPGNAIGPDTGEAADVAQLQNVLKSLGYPVQATGTFDDVTANAVCDFKKKHNLHQSYRLSNGEYAVNEYVGQATANAMIEALQNPSSTTTASTTNTTSNTTTASTTGNTANTTTTTPVQDTEDSKNFKGVQDTQTTQQPAQVEEKKAEASKTYTIKSGDTLSKIAQEQLGSSDRWKELYDLNKDVLGSNPNLIYPGREIKLP